MWPSCRDGGEGLLHQKDRELQTSDAFPAHFKAYIGNLELLKAKVEYTNRIPSIYALKKWRIKIEREKIPSVSERVQEL